MTTASYGLGERHRSAVAVYGPVLGLLATGAGLAAAELTAGLMRGTESPVIAVGEEFIDRSPVWLTEWAKNEFGTSDKDVLIGGAFVTIVLIGIGIGIAAVRGAWRLAIAATVVTGIIGAWAVTQRPSFSVSRLWPTVAGTAASLGVLWWYWRRCVREMRPAEKAADGESDHSVSTTVDRRTFVTGAVVVGSSAAIAAGAGRALQSRFTIASERQDLVLPGAGDSAGRLPSNAELGVDGVTPFQISNSDFYRIDTALGRVPQVQADSWELRVTGMVDRELTITFDELLSMPSIERWVTLSCVSNPVGGPYAGNALWLGTLLAPVLERAGVQPGAEQLVSRSFDGWTAGSPIEQIIDGRDAMFAYGMNGEPLPAEHGYPVRLVVPGLYGYVSATKWVTELEVTTWDAFDAYWVPRGWSAIAPFKMTTRIDTPRRGAERPAGQVAVGGMAWYPHVGISKVQVSIDGGDWQDAELGGVPSTDTWRQWVYRWDADPGHHEIRARAIDTDGVEQIEEPAPVAPDGASGYHTIDVEITA
jgi:DMSO/TMAO reductase YedYZ molybdopterin-dependent catalytic subunit